MATQTSTAYASPAYTKNRKSYQAKSKAPSMPLYSDRQIGVSAFLATPLAGAVMLAYNAWKLDRKGLAVGAIAGSLAITAVLVTVGQLVPFAIGQVLLIAVALGMKQVATNSFKSELEERRETGKGWQSNWKALGVSIISVIAIIPPVLLLAFALTGVSS